MNIVLLTATIAPPENAAQLQRMDPTVRLQDYATALEFYLRKIKSNTITSIIFVDNSNSNISTLRELVASYNLINEVEFISFFGLDYPPEYGRGYGEFKLVEYAMENSLIIQKSSATDNIWKITGRYILENIDAFTQSKPNEFDLYCNCRNVPRLWIDLYVICWTKQAYKLLLKDIYLDLREDTMQGSAEQSFRQIIDAMNTTLKIVKRFRSAPILCGFRGLDNQSYKEMGLKLLVRRIALVATPWLWI
jgi:hypothetical protein